MSEKKLLYVGCGLVAVLFGVMFFLTPTYNDDLWYLKNSIGQRGTPEHLWSTLIEACSHWRDDTGRLSNLFAAPFLSFFPKWVYSGLTASAIFFILIKGAELTGAPRVSPGSAFWIFTVVFIFPWCDYMFGVIYSINYVWGAFLGVAVLTLLGGRCRDWLFFLLCYLTGWWHEGLTVMLLAGVATYYFVRNPRRLLRLKIPRRPFIAVVGLSLGMLTIVLLPAFANQVAARYSHIFADALWITLLNILAWNLLFYIYFILYISGLCLRRVRRRWFADNRAQMALFTAFAVAGMVSTVIYFKYYNGARTGAFCQLMSAVAIIRIVPTLFTFKIRRNARIISVAAVLLLSVVNLVASIVVQTRLTKEFDRVNHLGRIAGGELPEVYYDPTPVRLGVDLLKPSYLALKTSYGLNNIILLPTRLEGFSPDNPDAARCSDTTLWIYHGLPVYNGAESIDNCELQLTLTDGGELITPVSVRRFHDANGENATYIRPPRLTLGEREITDARICPKK